MCVCVCVCYIKLYIIYHFQYVHISSYGLTVHIIISGKNNIQKLSIYVLTFRSIKFLFLFLFLSGLILHTKATNL